MKKVLFILSIFFSIPLVAQTNFVIGYRDAFADAFCYKREQTCQRVAPYASDVPQPNYSKNESSSNYMDGYMNGIIAGFNYRNSQSGVKYNFNEYSTALLNRKIENRRRAVQQSEDYFNEDLRRRNPPPTDSRQRALYDAIMNNNL